MENDRKDDNRIRKDHDKGKSRCILLLGIQIYLSRCHSRIKTENKNSTYRSRPGKSQRYAEETNRILTDRVSDYLFAQQFRIDNLKKEGITEGVYFTGDVMYDIFLKMKPKFDYFPLRELNLEDNKFIMMTLHRDFNVDIKEKLEKILMEVNKISQEIKVVFPVHPRTKKKINEFGFEHLIRDVTVIEPIDYLQLMGLTANCFKVITDSGGYQKEAYFAGKQAIIIMPDTSWRELTDCGLNILTKTKYMTI